MWKNAWESESIPQTRVVALALSGVSSQKTRNTGIPVPILEAQHGCQVVVDSLSCDSTVVICHAVLIALGISEESAGGLQC